MKRNLFAVSIVLIVVGALVVGVASFRVNQTASELTAALAELRIETQSVPTPPENADAALARARQDVAEAAQRIARVKGEVASVAQRQAARRSLCQARIALNELRAKTHVMVAMNAEFLSTLTELQARYEMKIVELEVQLSNAKKSQAKFPMKFWAGLLGILSGVSTLVLAWRRDRREVSKLRLELAAAKPDPPTADAVPER